MVIESFVLLHEYKPLNTVHQVRKYTSLCTYASNVSNWDRVQQLMYTKIWLVLCNTANLTAKPTILSTSQCMSAIQQNTRGWVSLLSQAAPTTLANQRRETPVPIQKKGVRPTSFNDIPEATHRKSSFWEGLARLYKVFSWQGHLRHFAGCRDCLQQLTFVLPASLEEKAFLIFSSIPRSFPVTLIILVVGINKTE